MATLTTSPQLIGSNTSGTIKTYLYAWYSNQSGTTCTVHAKLNVTNSGTTYTGTNKTYRLKIGSTDSGTTTWSYTPLNSGSTYTVAEKTATYSSGQQISASAEFWTYVYGNANISSIGTWTVPVFATDPTASLNSITRTYNSFTANVNVSSWGNGTGTKRRALNISQTAGYSGIPHRGADSYNTSTGNLSLTVNSNSTSNNGATFTIQGASGPWYLSAWATNGSKSKWFPDSTAYYTPPAPLRNFDYATDLEWSSEALNTLRIRVQGSATENNPTAYVSTKLRVKIDNGSWSSYKDFGGTTPPSSDAIMFIIRENKLYSSYDPTDKITLDKTITACSVVQVEAYQEYQSQESQHLVFTCAPYMCGAPIESNSVYVTPLSSTEYTVDFSVATWNDVCASLSTYPSTIRFEYVLGLTSIPDSFPSNYNTLYVSSYGVSHAITQVHTGQPDVQYYGIVRMNNGYWNTRIDGEPSMTSSTDDLTVFSYTLAREPEISGIVSNFDSLNRFLSVYVNDIEVQDGELDSVTTEVSYDPDFSTIVDTQTVSQLGRVYTKGYFRPGEVLYIRVKATSTFGVDSDWENDQVIVPKPTWGIITMPDGTRKKIVDMVKLTSGGVLGARNWIDPTVDGGNTGQNRICKKA